MANKPICIEILEQIKLLNNLGRQKDHSKAPINKLKLAPEVF